MVESMSTVYWASSRLARGELLSMCDRAERARYAAYRLPADRDRFLVGVAVVRQVTAAALRLPAAAVRIDRSCPQCDRPHGRPTLPGTEWQVSVSHSGQLVAVAVAWGEPVGVDVEAIPAHVSPDLLPNVLAASEPCSSAAEFIAYWAAKEAVLKCTGDGVLVPLADVIISHPADAPVLLAYPGRPDYPGRITLTTLRVPAQGYAAALARITLAGGVTPTRQVVVTNLWPTLVREEHT